MGFSFQGFKISIGDIAGEIVDAEEIGCLTSFDYTENEPTIIDDTCAGTVEFKDFLLGLKESSTVTIDLSLDHENLGYIEAIEAKEAGTLKRFFIEFADTPATTESFEGYVMTASKVGAVDDKFVCSMSIRVKGGLEDYVPPAI